MLLRMVKKRTKKFFENFKAVKIHPISKGLATPTNLSTTGKFERCSLRGVIRGLSVEMSTGKPSHFEASTKSMLARHCSTCLLHDPATL